jgi:hypothetical protein
MYMLQVYGLVVLVALIAVFVIAMTVLIIVIAKDYIRSRHAIQRILSSMYVRN